jgi:hypothetical protein
MKKFDPKEPVQFRNAPEQVRIIATDLKDDRPIVIAVTVAGKETVGHRHADGRVQSDRDNVYDIVNVPKKYEVWINFYDDVGDPRGYDSYSYSSRAIADESADSTRIACIRVEFTEGEGI